VLSKAEGSTRTTLASGLLSGYSPTPPHFAGMVGMPDAENIWRRALELGAHLGLVTAERVATALTLPSGISPSNVTALASSLGIPADTLDALVRLAHALPAGPAGLTVELPTGTQVTARVASYLQDGSGEREAGGGAACSLELTLEALDERRQGWRFVGPITVVIGRSHLAQVHLEDPRVSGNHAEIEVTGEACHVRDLGSAHGIFVNGKPVTHGPLLDGDRVRVGGTELRVSVRPAAVVPPAGAVSCEACKARFTPEQVRADLEGWNGMRFRCASCRMSDADEAPEIPGYVLERKLRKGGQGQVWLARETATPGRRVAVKTVRLPYGLPDDQVSRRVQSFQREASIAMTFRHPNAVEVYKFDVVGRMFFAAMEYLAGGDLYEYVEARGVLGWQEACSLMMQALDALSAAHAAKIVHRDVKPENLLLTEAAPGARLKVADFGLAKNFALAGLSGMTSTGVAGGTLGYISPEQLTDYKYAGPNADVFSLGAVLFRIMTGEEMYSGPEPSVVERILSSPIRSLSSVRSEVPAPIAFVVDRALSRDLGLRYADAGQMRAALGRALEEV